MLKAFSLCVTSDLKIMSRRRAQWINPIVFFIIFVSLFGIGLGLDVRLNDIAPAVIWIAFLLTSLFTVEAMFRTELDEGSLEPLLLSPYPLWWLMLAKSVAIWLASCLPLILSLPLLSLFLQLNLIETSVLILSLLAGSPALTLIAMVGAALTLALHRSGVFLGLLMLPLYIPILILGQSSVLSVDETPWPLFQLALLSAISILAMTFAPHGAAAALRAAYDE